MMLDVEPLVREMAPGLLTREPASVACIATTRRKFLVFQSGVPAYPICVLEYGDQARLKRTANVLTSLSGKLPGLVPAVIRCAPTPGGEYVLIQQGIDGVPWFRVADGIRTPDAWRALLDRALTAMTALHTAIRDQPEWTSSFDLAAEIARQVRFALDTDVPLTPATMRLAHEWQSASAVCLRAHAQHGDFSLNNLLVGDESLAIIDFDEFNTTSAPLHDAFGLALSFALSQGGVSPLPRAELIGECVRRGCAVVQAPLLPGLLLHHLLLRINQCHGEHRRARLRRVLIEWADELARTPEAFLAA